MYYVTRGGYCGQERFRVKVVQSFAARRFVVCTRVIRFIRATIEACTLLESDEFSANHLIGVIFPRDQSYNPRVVLS